MIETVPGGAEGAPDPGAPQPGAGASRLWLGILQRIAGRAAHEVKNSLNGVAVNLEVVRSRSARPGAAADGIARFADSASEQFERLSAQADALLALARPPREPCDVALVVRSLHVLLGGVLLPGTERAALAMEAVPGSAPTRSPGDTVRVVLGEVVLDAMEHAVPVVVRVDEGEGGVVVQVRSADGDGALPPLAPAVAALAAADGVRVERRPAALTFIFAASR